MKIYIYTLVKKCFVSAALLFAITILSFSGGCKTNRTEVASGRQLLKLDSNSFDSWEIVPGKNTDTDAYKMIRKNNKWMISVKGNEPAEPDTAYLRRSIQHISNLQAVTELNTPQKNWDTLQLTDKDTRLIVYKDGKTIKEIILGKMFFSKANKTTYYVRLKDEDEIFTVQQYLEGSFKVPAQKLRKKEMVNVAQSQIANIIFLKPEGIDFTMLRAGQQVWSIDGILTTDVIANQYVAALTNLQISSFAESPNIGAILSIEITTYNGKEISLRAFRKNSETWIISSSANQGNYMELKENEIQTLFPAKEYFMQSQAK